jgi:glucose-6-phosphate-specific signal transduction histidine kinase
MKRKNSNPAKFVMFGSAITSVLVIVLLFIYVVSDDFPGHFELIVFIMSFTALTLTIFQSLEIQKQLKETRRSTKELSKADHSIEELVEEEKTQNNLLTRDIKLDEILIRVLSEHGINIEDHTAKKISQKIKKSKNQN